MTGRLNQVPHLAVFLKIIRRFIEYSTTFDMEDLGDGPFRLESTDS